MSDWTRSPDSAMSNIEARARREREPPWLFELCAPRTILLLVGGCGAFVRFLVMSDERVDAEVSRCQVVIGQIACQCLVSGFWRSK